MPDTLLSMFPAVQDLLSQSPEELGGKILEIAPSVMQNGTFSKRDLLGPFRPGGYSDSEALSVGFAVDRALSWLAEQRMVTPEFTWDGPRYRLTDLRRSRPDKAVFQSYLVTTPLGVAGASLISLTLRSANADDSIALAAARELLSKGIEGWIVETVTSGDALLDRLADGFGTPNPEIRAAIVAALDERAAVLQFSDPRPLSASSLKNLVTDIMTLAKHPREAIVGIILLSHAIIAVQVSVGVGEGLRTLANHAIVEIGDTIISGALPQR